MAVARETAHARKLQGPHSNHHVASANPDRAVTLSDGTVVAKGAQAGCYTCNSLEVTPEDSASDAATAFTALGSTGVDQT